MSPVLVFFVGLFLWFSQKAIAIEPSCHEILVPTQSKSKIFGGQLPINSQKTSALYFVFYGGKNITDFYNLPVIVWLNGGPGTSSLYGNFYEIGPTFLEKANGNELIIEKERKITWNSAANLMFVDQPLSVGGSIAGSYEEIPENETQISEQFIQALRQFYSLDLGKKLEKTPIFFAGEGQAGKNIVNIAKKIIEENNKNSYPIIPLKGIALGDPWIAGNMPIYYGDVAYNLGIIDISSKIGMESSILKYKFLFENKDYEKAWFIAGVTLLGEIIKTATCSIYNYREQPKDLENGQLDEYYNQSDIKERYHMDHKIKQANWSQDAQRKLSHEMIISDIETVEFILNNSEIKVLIYQGQNDVYVNSIGTLEWIEKLKFKENEDFKFKKQDLLLWKTTDNCVAGYGKKIKNLEYRIILNAGHSIPNDAQAASLEMISEFVGIVYAN